MAKIASTSYAQLAYVEEKVFGTTPTDKDGTFLRMTGESLEQTISKETSKEINATRQIAGMYLTDAQVGGGFNIELSAREYDPFIEATLMDTWTSPLPQGKSAEVEVTFDPSGKITFKPEIPNLEKLPVGSFVNIFGDIKKPENKGPYYIKEVDKDSITVSAKLTAEVVTKAVLHSSRCTNGVKQRAFSIEKNFSDLGHRTLYQGMRAGKMSLNFESKTALTGSFEFVGMTTKEGSKNFLAGTKYKNSQAGSIIDSILGMKHVYIDGEPVEGKMTAGIKKVSLDFDNQLQGLDAIGKLGNVDVMVGTINCTGAISMYFVSGKAYEDTIKQTRFNISWCVFDNEGHGYGFTLPSIEFTSPKAPAGSQNEPVMIDIDFAALMDAKTQKTIFIDRF